MVPTYISPNVDPVTQFKDADREWKRIKKEGSNYQDIWTDGMYLNLIRSRMIRLKKMIGDKELEIPDKLSYEFNVRRRR